MILCERACTSLYAYQSDSWWNCCCCCCSVYNSIIIDFCAREFVIRDVHDKPFAPLRYYKPWWIALGVYHNIVPSLCILYWYDCVLRGKISKPIYRVHKRLLIYDAGFSPKIEHCYEPVTVMEALNIRTLEITDGYGQTGNVFSKITTGKKTAHTRLPVSPSIFRLSDQIV